MSKADKTLPEVAGPEVAGVLGLAHLGVAVADLAGALKAWEALGLKLSHTETVESEGVRTAHLPLGLGGSDIELLEPLDADSPVGRFLTKRGPGLHHVALQVTDIEAAVESARQAGLKVIGQAPRPGAGNTLVAFLHPRSMGGLLVELVEYPR